MLLFPGPIVSIFAAGDTALIEAAAPAVRIVVALCALGYTGQMMSSYFECVEKIGEAIVCGIALYIIFTIPLVFVLGAAMGVSGVWWAQLVAHVGAGVLSIFLAVREVKRLHALRWDWQHSRTAARLSCGWPRRALYVAGLRSDTIWANSSKAM